MINSVLHYEPSNLCTNMLFVFFYIFIDLSTWKVFRFRYDCDYRDQNRVVYWPLVVTCTWERHMRESLIFFGGPKVNSRRTEIIQY